MMQSYLAASWPRPCSNSAVQVGKNRGVITGCTLGLKTRAQVRGGGNLIVLICVWKKVLFGMFPRMLAVLKWGSNKVL